MKSTKRFFSHLAIVGVALTITACSVMGPEKATWQEDKEYRVTILHTNDHHGRFWQNSNGEYGMAARKTLIDNLREDVILNNGHSLLLSGGDINTGVPESDLQDAEPDFRGMNMLKYDAMAVGNHEFDNPLSVLRKQQEWAGFPFLSANIFDANTGERLFDAYKIFQIDDVKVAVVGFTTDDTIKQGNPEIIKDISIKSPIEVAKTLIPELRKKADLVIAVTHMGHYEDGNYGGNAPGDVTLARTVPGIDVIVGGHSQNPLMQPDEQNGTLILQAHEWGKYVGRLDFVYKNGAIVSSEYQLIPVNLKKKITNAEGKSERVFIEQEIPQDPAMLALLTPFQEKGQKGLNIEIGYSNVDFIGERNQVRSEETNLGNLIAAAMKSKVNADIGIMNSGGIRDSLEKGIVTYKSALKVQPFGNMVSFVDFTADELSDYLSVIAAKQAGTGAFAQFSGVALTLQDGKATNILVNGQALQANQTYRIAVNNYTASGGDGYPKITNHPNYVNSGYVDADVLVEYIQRNSPLEEAKFAPTGAVKR